MQTLGPIPDALNEPESSFYQDPPPNDAHGCLRSTGPYHWLSNLSVLGIATYCSQFLVQWIWAGA